MLLIGIFIIVMVLLGVYVKYTKFIEIKEAELKVEFNYQLEEFKKNFVKQSESINRGFDYEKLAPYLKGFPFDPSELIFFGQPIDYIAFENAPEGIKIHIIDIKTGMARLTRTQKSIRNAIKMGEIYFHEIRVDENGVDKIKTLGVKVLPKSNKQIKEPANGDV